MGYHLSPAFIFKYPQNGYPVCGFARLYSFVSSLGLCLTMSLMVITGGEAKKEKAEEQGRRRGKMGRKRRMFRRMRRAKDNLDYIT